MYDIEFYMIVIFASELQNTAHIVYLIYIVSIEQFKLLNN